VLSDPFQRQRYDAQISAGSDSGDEPGSDVELVDADSGAASSAAAQPTGWRKLLAPPPPKDPGGGANGNGNGTRNGNGKTAAGGSRGTTRNGRPRPDPTLVLPEGMRIAEPRTRGMALLFDLSILIVVFFAVSLIVPRLIQSDYQDIQDRITNVSSLKDKKQSLADAKGAKDKASANKDYKNAQKDAADAGVPQSRLGDTSKQLDKYSNSLSDKIKTTGYITTGLTFVLALAYLVPLTALKGRTLGMRGRKIKVVRVDGSPVGWYAAFTRYAIPILLALAIPSFGVILGLGMVAWGYFDKNGQGIHDKLARTVIVDA
jgi:uncharacterized RDD family membrane protein YckC